MKQPDVLIMTGDKLRHQYFALKILRAFPNSLFLIERQTRNAWGGHLKSPSPFLKKHFQDFHNFEKKYFLKEVMRNRKFLNNRTFLSVASGEVNNVETIKNIVDLNPKLIAVLGTSLLKKQIIEAFPRRIINYHAGLSPYYRGSGTNVFPFLNRKLEYVGITIHYLDETIDGGTVILQGRPIFEHDDNTHTIGCKNLIMGTNLMIMVLKHYLDKGPPEGKKQDFNKGNLYQKKDFNEKVLRDIYSNIASGIVDDYIKVQPLKINIVDKIN